MRALLDVNMLIALHDAQHVHHAAANTWFRQNAAAGWASCPLTQNGCLRVMCQPAYPNPCSPNELLPRLRRSFANAAHEFWPDDISLVDEERFRSDHIHGHRQLTDLYLLALAVHRSGRLVTFDARVPVSAVRQASDRHLVRLLA